MLITNVRVYDMEESIIASGFPHSDCPDYSCDRAYKLSKAKHGSGHDCFLKGILVNFDLTAPSYFWPQFQRYHFADIISSESKMHSILNFDIEKKCNEYVTKQSIDQLKSLVDLYNQFDIMSDEEKNIKFNDMFFDTNIIPTTKNDLFQVILSNTPMGLNLTARITTNYLQLKSIYFQRKTHRLKEWKYFIDWIKTLPNSLFVTDE